MLEQQVQELYFEGPADMVIETLQTIERFRERVREPAKVIETTAVVADESNGDGEEG